MVAKAQGFNPSRNPAPATTQGVNPRKREKMSSSALSGGRGGGKVLGLFRVFSMSSSRRVVIRSGSSVRYISSVGEDFDRGFLLHLPVFFKEDEFFVVFREGVIEVDHLDAVGVFLKNWWGDLFLELSTRWTPGGIEEEQHRFFLNGYSLSEVSGKPVALEKTYPVSERSKLLLKEHPVSSGSKDNDKVRVFLLEFLEETVEGSSWGVLEEVEEHRGVVILGEREGMHKVPQSIRNNDRVSFPGEFVEDF